MKRICFTCVIVAALFFVTPVFAQQHGSQNNYQVTVEITKNGKTEVITKSFATENEADVFTRVIGNWPQPPEPPKPPKDPLDDGDPVVWSWPSPPYYQPEVEDNDNYLPLPAGEVRPAPGTRNTTGSNKKEEGDTQPLNNELLSGEQNTISSLRLYPNPAVSHVAVELNIAKPEDVLMRITDVNGKEVYREIERNQSGTIIKQVALPQLMPGTYLVTVLAGKDQSSTQLFIQ